VTLYRRDGSSYIASLHGFPIFVKFPGDRRANSDAVQFSSALLEGYISPPPSQAPQSQGLQQEGEEDGETQNPLVEMASSSTSTGAALGAAEEMKGDSKRLSSVSVSMAYPSAEIPNKVAYIAVQISAIQDLRF
jgi:hypothetical protein